MHAFITLIMCLTATSRGERDSPGIVRDTIVQLSQGFCACFSSMTARRRLASHCKVVHALFWNNLRDGEVKKELCFLCLFLLLRFKTDEVPRVPPKIRFRPTFLLLHVPSGKKTATCFVESRRCFCPISFRHNLDIVLHLNIYIYITEVKKKDMPASELITIAVNL